MPLPDLHWKFVGSETTTSATVTGVLASLYNLGQATTYADGSTRIVGSGSAWSWDRQLSGLSTVAAIGAPPSYAPYLNNLGMRYILAGDGSSAPLTVLTPDTAATPTGVLWMGMNRGAPVYGGSWTAAQPFGSGFSGYWRGGGNINQILAVGLYESEEACVVTYTASNGLVLTLIFGALTDPLSATGAESNGRLYFMQTVGYGTTTTDTFLSSNNATNGTWGNHSNTSNVSHCGYFSPGTTTVNPASRLENFVWGGSSTTGTWRGAIQSMNGDAIKLPFHLVRVSTGTWLGPMRNMWVVPSFPSNSIIKNGGSVLGYASGMTSTVFRDTVMLGV